MNGAVFHYQYKNQQIINVYPTGQQPLINLGKSKIDGGELEIVTRPIRSLTLRAGAGFLRSEVQDGTLSTGSIDGQELPYAPHFSGTVSLDWEVFNRLERRAQSASRHQLQLQAVPRAAQRRCDFAGRLLAHQRTIEPEDGQRRLGGGTLVAQI